jgi:hypothetical protein
VNLAFIATARHTVFFTQSLSLLLEAQTLLFQSEPLLFEPPALHLNLLLLIIRGFIAPSLGVRRTGNTSDNCPCSCASSSADQAAHEGTAQGAA